MTRWLPLALVALSVGCADLAASSTPDLTVTSDDLAAASLDLGPVTASDDQGTTSAGDGGVPDDLAHTTTPPELGHVTLILSYDLAGKPHQAGDASMCPTGWRYLGDLNTDAVCESEVGGTVTYISAACPAGWQLLGEYGSFHNYSICWTPDDVLQAAFTEAPRSCPAGWSYLFEYSTSLTCVKPRPGTVMRFEACPANWSLLAHVLGTAACFTDESFALAIFESVPGKARDECPDGWSFIGLEGQNTHRWICTAPPSVTVTTLTSSPSGSACPVGWRELGTSYGALKTCQKL